MYISTCFHCLHAQIFRIHFSRDTSTLISVNVPFITLYMLCRQLSGMQQMQALGHQVVGSEDKSHEDVKLMYEKFFGGEAVNLKRALKTGLGSFRTKQLLSQIFQVLTVL